ncbi:MAG TPA: glycoside hydrolase family 16 protein [Candidatus Baltobacteraceae bacterium]
MSLRHGLLILLAALGSCSPPGEPTSLSAHAVTASRATKIFDDEFDGASLNRVWSTCYPWANPKRGCTNGGKLELEWYLPDNVALRGGYLNLTAKPQTAYAGHPYTSGMIATGGRPNTKSTFSYLYGYAEARIKLPRGAGMWPAFWLVPANRTWPPEIDIMEFQGVRPKNDIVTIHWGTAKHPQQNGSTVDTGTDLWRGYHTYGLDWEASRVTWYFDGKAIKSYTDTAHIPHQPMYVILNLAVGGWLPHQLEPKRKSFPATASVDYVRIWSASRQ